MRRTGRPRLRGGFRRSLLTTPHPCDDGGCPPEPLPAPSSQPSPAPSGQPSIIPVPRPSAAPASRGPKRKKRSKLSLGGAKDAIGAGALNETLAFDERAILTENVEHPIPSPTQTLPLLPYWSVPVSLSPELLDHVQMALFQPSPYVSNMLSTCAPGLMQAAWV